MLLLVLTLVLVAFALLLVSLAAKAAIWAWISVALSVAAAGALVYDWAQRRAAVKSGGGDRAVSGPAPVLTGTPEPPTTAIPVMGGAMSEPATEVFPAVRPNSPSGPPVAEAGETVAFRPVGSPSGSPDRPSGAKPDGGTSSDQWSPRVTSGDAERGKSVDSPAATPSGDRPGGEREPLGVSGASRSDGPEDRSKPPVQDTSAPVRDKSAQWKSNRPEDSAKPGESKERDTPAASPAGPDADRTTAIPPVGPLAGAAAAAGAAGLAGGKAADKMADKADRESTQPPADRAPADGDPTRATADRGPAERPSDRAEDKPADREPGKPGERPEPPDADNARTTAMPLSALRKQSPAQQPASVPPPAASTEDERPEDEEAASAAADAEPTEDVNEEAASPAEAAIVAALEDEVLVVDEHPLYHVAGCAELAGNETIPLPAREAVEYGFTPCGVCTPVHTLATRNRAASSS